MKTVKKKINLLRIELDTFPFENHFICLYTGLFHCSILVFFRETSVKQSPKG